MPKKRDKIRTNIVELFAIERDFWLIIYDLRDVEPPGPKDLEGPRLLQILGQWQAKMVELQLRAQKVRDTGKVDAFLDLVDTLSDPSRFMVPAAKEVLLIVTLWDPDIHNLID